MKFRITKDRVHQMALLAVGSIISAAGIQLFLAPAHLVTAGVAGLAMLMAYLTPIPTGVWLFLLNTPIFLLARKKVDKEFLVGSLLGMAGLSVALWALEPLIAWSPVKDLYLNLIFGGAVTGLGMGLVFKARCSQGGTDVIVAALRKTTSINLGVLMFILNASVVLVLAVIYGLEPALATVVVIAIESVVVDKTIIGLNANKAMLTVTSNPQAVSSALMDKLDRGATILQANGAFTGEPRPVVMIVLNTRQLARATKIVKDIDPKAFTFVHDVTEVIGHGFTAPPI
ncbi:MAG: YitT family protein [Myxococcota bacterium]|jgi:uncharacterized membrane-anchored protein YitT (DUF2179 family)|nr:YitT family protein [Myxococcota bacterium]MBP8969984.1 YitT family protein [Myxococcota bacterium]HHW97656.1 YitT family protein [Oligoflexales bacterium]HQC44445.1 YitT family protein [Myxococcota bacterium]HQL56697.1 YitT family protein [Myxococcota bacterium]